MLKGRDGVPYLRLPVIYLLAVGPKKKRHLPGQVSFRCCVRALLGASLSVHFHHKYTVLDFFDLVYPIEVANHGAGRQV